MYDINLHNSAFYRCFLIWMIWLRERERETEREREKERERERERERKWGDREKIKLWTLNCTCVLCYTRISNPILSIKFSIDSLYPKFLHLTYSHIISWDVGGSCSVFKNVQADKCMNLNEDSLEKELGIVSEKKMYLYVEQNFNTAYLYYFSVSLCMFSHMIVHECMHVLRFDSAWKSGL